MAGARRASTLLATEPAVADGPRRRRRAARRAAGGRLRRRHVQLRPRDAEARRRCATSTCTWPPAPTSGVVGRTGSGKTTHRAGCSPASGTSARQRRRPPRRASTCATSRSTRSAAGSASSPRTSSCSGPRCATTSRCSAAATATDDELRGRARRGRPRRRGSRRCPTASTPASAGEPRAVGGRGPAPGLRPGVPGRPRRRGARRGVEPARPAHRARASREATERAAGRPHRGRHRPPARHARPRSTRSRCSSAGRVVEHGPRAALAARPAPAATPACAARPGRRTRRTPIEPRSTTTARPARGGARMTAPRTPGARHLRPAPLDARVALRLARNEPVAYLTTWFGWVVFFSLPLLSGLLVKVALDRVADGSTSRRVGAARRRGRHRGGALDLAGGHRRAVARLLGRLADGAPGQPAAVAGRRPRAGRRPAAGRARRGGQPLPRRRPGLAMVLDVWLDLSGAAVAATVALVVLRVDRPPAAALAVAVPVADRHRRDARGSGPRLRVWRREAREATARVTGFIGDTFGGVLAVQAGGAEVAVRRRFAQLNAQRARVEPARPGRIRAGAVARLRHRRDGGRAWPSWSSRPRSGGGDLIGRRPRPVRDVRGDDRRAAQVGRPLPGRTSGRPTCRSTGWPTCWPTPDRRGVVAPTPTYLRHGPRPLRRGPRR